MTKAGLLPVRICEDCDGVDGMFINSERSRNMNKVVAQRKLLVKSPIGNSLLTPMLCNECRDERLTHNDTSELCHACNFTRPDHGMYCPAGPNPGRLD